MHTWFLLVAAWLFSLPVLFKIGVSLAKKVEAESRRHKLSVASQVASWAFGAYFIVLLFCPPKPGGVRGGSEVLYWLWVASCPLFCFLTGLAFGITRRKRTLVLLIAVAVLLGVLLLAIGFIAIIGVPAVVGPFGLKGVAAGGVGQEQVAVGDVLLVYGEYPAVLDPALMYLAVGEPVFLPREVETRVRKPAARAAARALACPPGVVLLDVAGIAVMVIEAAQFAPYENEALPKSHFSECVLHLLSPQCGFTSLLQGLDHRPVSAAHVDGSACLRRLSACPVPQ